jgi:hypothetical protein
VLSAKGQQYADSFPSANLAILYTTSDTFKIIDYDQTNKKKWGIVGHGLINNFTNSNFLYYNNPMIKNIVYPMSYKRLFTDSITTYNNFYNNGKWKCFLDCTKQYDTLYADAYGTLKLPNATYDNVLRVYQSGELGGYYWFYTNGVHWPLLVIAAGSGINLKTGLVTITSWSAVYNAGTTLP